MSAAKNKRAVIVGIFVLLGILIFIAGVLALGGQRKTFEKGLTVRVMFDDVNGLQPGNNIWFSGVKVGTVKSIGLSGPSQVEVLLNIGQKSQQYIHKDAKAKIGSDGLIGNKIVVIYGGTAQAPVVKDGDQLVVQNATSTDEIMNTFQKNNQNLLAVTNDFKVITQRLVEGQGSIGKLLTDESLMNHMQATIATLQRASTNAQLLTANLADYTAKLKSKGSFANELVTDTTIFHQLRATTVQIQEATRTANAVTDNLKKVTEGLSNNLNSTNTPAGVLLNDKEAAANLKATLQNLQSGTEKLDENMEALQHNFFLRGFFKRKAKAEAKAEETSDSTSTSTSH